MAGEIIEGQSDEPVGLELIGSEQKHKLLSLIADALAADIKERTTEAPKGVEPRILRILKSIDLQTYEALRSELNALLELIGSDATDEELRESLREQIKVTISERLGPKFSHVVMAEGFVSGPAFNMPSIVAAVRDLPNTIDETPPKSRYVDAVRALFALQTLCASATESSKQLSWALVNYIFGAVRKFNPSPRQENNEGSFFKATVNATDFEQFRDTLYQAAEQCGIAIRINRKYADDGKPKVEVEIIFDFSKEAESTSLEKL